MRIAVYCGSKGGTRAVYGETARALGTVLAQRGHTLVYGGGREGLMGALADAALDAGGSVEGVILEAFYAENAHHPRLDSLQRAADMRTRKRGLEERADAFIALPGGLGTLEEITEILSFRKIALHDRLLVLLDVEGFFEPLRAQIERGIAEGFDRSRILDYLAVADAPESAVALCEDAQTARIPRAAP